MLMSKFFSLLIFFSLFLPVVTQAGEIDMQAGRVRINQDSHGNFYVDTGNTKLTVPSRSSYVNRNRPLDHFNIFWRNSCKKSGSVVKQETTQVSRNNRHSTQSSTVSVSCY